MRTFGSDPEFFLTKDGQLHCAIEIIKSSPKERIKRNGNEFYYDNALAECAIKPSKSRANTILNFHKCFQTYANLVNPYKLTTTACHVFKSIQLIHKDAREAGCAPDMCAYELTQKDPPKNIIEKTNLRSGGGHIHVGAKSLVTDGPEPILFVYLMDLLLAVPFLWIDKDKTSAKRRKLYGQAGRYRVKDYGIEYRTLGNFWLNSPKLVALVYDLSMHCLDLIENKDAWKLWDFDFNRLFKQGKLTDTWKCKGYDPKLLCSAVNTGNKQKAKPLLELALKLMPETIKQDVKKQMKETSTDFYENWNLK